MVLGLVEWTVRMVMLVLAGLVTLAILHAIHAMSTDAGGPAPAPPGRLAPMEHAAPQQQPAPQPVEARKAAPSPPTEAGGTVLQGGRLADPPPQDDRLQRWVEAIAYALLALAGLAAIGLILLWQLLRQTKRLADAADARPRGA